MLRILPNLYCIPLPLPRNPLKEINCYVLTSKDRNLIIDTGMNRPACREAMDAGLHELGIDMEKTDIIATHFHADHQGQVFYLLKNGSKAYMGALDAAFLMSGATPHARRVPIVAYASKSGIPEDVLLETRQNHPGLKYGPQRSVAYIPIREGDVFEVGDYSLKAIETPGHSRGHICLYEPEKKILFSGDHVLGDITPNIPAWNDVDDPLGDYIASLKKVYELDVALCLPGHRTPVKCFKDRILELIEHHRVRANEVLSILEEKPNCAYWTASQMTWDIVSKSWDDFPSTQKWFATGETVAHLRYLEEKQVIQREMKGGIIFYSTKMGERLASV